MLQQSLHLGRSCLRRLAWALGLAVLALGCGSSTQERTVEDVTLLETRPSALDTDDVLSGLAIAAPRTFLWVERERDVYDANLLARDLERVERFYRAQGYYDVKVVAARVEAVAAHEVAIEVHVTPGPRVTVRRVSSDERLLGLPVQVAVKIKTATTLQPDAPFEEAALGRDKAAIEKILKEAGYAYATVRVRGTVDLNARVADVKIEVDPGRSARFGEIRIQGLKQIPETKVRAALGLRRGGRYSESAQEEARGELGDMGVFSRIDIAPDLSHPESDEVPVLVTLEEDQLKKLVLGGGTSLDSLTFSMHLRTGWEHKNFLGGARRLTIEAKPGFDLFPTRFENFQTLVKPTQWLFTLDASAKLTQPAIFNGRTEGRLEIAFSRYPLLYPLAASSDANSEVIVGYLAPRGKLALERSYWGQRISLEPSYNLEAQFPFFYQNNTGASTGLETVWVSYPRLSTILTTKPGDLFRSKNKRDLTLSFRNSLEVAGMKLGGTRIFGGSVSDVKVEPEVRILAPIIGTRSNDQQRAPNLSLATRFKLGFVLVPDYGSRTTSDQQKLLFRAFYSGGASSNRGYAYRAISPHGPVGFLIPTGLNCGTQPVDANGVMQPPPDGCTKPLGGFTEWEASLELRWAGFYPITLVAFMDGSDVTRDVGVIQFQYPHLSAGPGVRYESPVGPIRLDFGIRIPGLQAIGQKELPLSHGQERPEFFGLPAAIQLAFGEAF